MSTPNLRFILWGALALLLLLNYQTWLRDYPAPVATAPVAGAPSTNSPANDLGNRIPEAQKSEQGAPAGPQTPAGTPGPAAAGSVDEGARIASAAPRIHVRTDVLDVDIDTRGGTLERVDLTAYPQVKGESTPVRLENDDGPSTLYLLQSGLTGPTGEEYPTHLAAYHAAQADYSLDGGRTLRVPLTWSAGGVTVTKTYVFTRGEYRIDVDYAVHNGSGSPWEGRPYAQILRNDPPTKRSYFNVD